MNSVIIYFLIFMIYSFFGWCFECVHMAITTKEIVNRGFLNGPFIPVYGIGLTLITSLLSKFKDNFLVLLVMSILIIGLLEYFISFMMEKLFKIRWWDYSNRNFNINGRVCLNTMTLFVTGAILIVYKVHPLIIKILDETSYKVLFVIFIISLIYFALDLIISLKMTLSYLKSNIKSNRLDKTPEIKKYISKILKKRKQVDNQCKLV